jgi:hypothetical protein
VQFLPFVLNTTDEVKWQGIQNFVSESDAGKRVTGKGLKIVGEMEF